MTVASQEKTKGAAREQPARTRRRFLSALALSGSAGLFAAAEMLARPGQAATASNGPPAAAGLREENLRRALAAREAAAAPAEAARPSLQTFTVLPPADLPPASAASAALPSESTVVRMQRELQRALEKPMDQRKWSMVIDTRKCIGCSACTVACKAENHLPPGVVYRPVIEEEIGEFPNVSRRWLPRPCQQCEDPPCVDVCPVNATWKREDGIVVVDYNACIGCRYCITACPYGARYFDFGDNYTDDTPAVQPYEQSPSPEYGRVWPRDDEESPIGNARKCQFCVHRLNAGMLPACVTTCVGNATYFGDKNDPESLVSELIGSPRAMRLKEEMGTNPKVYYLA